MIALHMVLLPLLVLAAVLLAPARYRSYLTIAFGIIHTLLATLLYLGLFPHVQALGAHLQINTLSASFLLEYTGLQLVCLLALPKAEATLPSLTGMLLLSACTVLTIEAASPLFFVSAYAILLFVPSFCSFLQGNDWRGEAVFLLLAVVSSLLLFMGAPTAFAGAQYKLNIWLLLTGIIRLGLVPFHLWVRRLVLRFPIQWSILFFLSYPSVALFMPLHRPIILGSFSPLLLHLAWISAIYGATVAAAQSELRKTFCFLLVSLFGSLALGFALSSSLASLSGVLLYWISAGLAFAGFGLAIELLESRFGDLNLRSHHGLIENVPRIGVFFLIFGLASVGFPGMCVFIGEEILLSNLYEQSRWAVIPIVVALSLNGVTVLRWFFSVFYGESTLKASGVSMLLRERIAFLVLLVIIIATGIFPQPLFHLSRVAEHNTSGNP